MNNTTDNKEAGEYNNKEQEGRIPDRRKGPPSLEVAVATLTTKFDSLQKSVSETLADHTSKLEIYMNHSDALQTQIQNNLQRQLDQNNEQHQDILQRSERTTEKLAETFKDEMNRMVSMAERRFDDAEIARKSFEKGILNRVEILEKAPDSKDAGLLRKIREIVFILVATAIAGAAITWVVSTITVQMDQIKALQHVSIIKGVAP